MGDYPQRGELPFEPEGQAVLYNTPMEYRARQIAWAYNYPVLNPLPGGIQQSRRIQALRDPRTAQFIQALPGARWVK